MSSWLERHVSSHHIHLAATAVISGVAVASLIYGSQAIRRKAAVDELKASIPDLDDSHHADLVNPTAAILRSALTIPVKLTDFGTASHLSSSTREDDKAAALARRAQHGDYDEGIPYRCPLPKSMLTLLRTNHRATNSHFFFSHSSTI